MTPKQWRNVADHAYDMRDREAHTRAIDALQAMAERDDHPITHEVLSRPTPAPAPLEPSDPT